VNSLIYLIKKNKKNLNDKKKISLVLIIIIISTVLILGGILTWGFLTEWGQKNKSSAPTEIEVDVEIEEEPEKETEKEIVEIEKETTEQETEQKRKPKPETIEPTRKPKPETEVSERKVEIVNQKIIKNIELKMLGRDRGRGGDYKWIIGLFLYGKDKQRKQLKTTRATLTNRQTGKYVKKTIGDKEKTLWEPATVKTETQNFYTINFTYDNLNWPYICGDEIKLLLTPRPTYKEYKNMIAMVKDVKLTVNFKNGKQQIFSTLYSFFMFL
jgi:hypothetical protein